MKRFIDTEKWCDPWFRRLSPAHKLAWNYIWDSCDNAGVVLVDWDLFSYLSGVSVTEAEVAEAFGDRVQDIGKGRWWIPEFIPFQFGELSPVSRVHQSVFTLLKRHGIDSLLIAYLNSPIPYQRGPDTPKDRDRERDRDKDRDQDLGKGCGENPKANGVPAVRMLPHVEIRTRVNVLYKRPHSAPWGNDEEHYLIEVAKRPDCLAELVEIESFFKSGSYLPVKAKNLLLDWTGLLDRARNAHETNRRNSPQGVNRNNGTLNDPSRYSSENLARIKAIREKNKVPDPQ